FGYGVANYVTVADGGIAGLGCNWYGTAVYSEIEDNVNLTGKILNKTGAETEFVPYLTSGVDDDGATIGFQPETGVCNGTPVEITAAAPDHILCGEPSGEIAVNWTGGVPNYTIAWTGGGPVAGLPASPYTITGLSAGGYTITVTDANGSTATAMATIEYLPVTNTTDMPNTHYATIQAAVNAATAGDV